MASLKGFSPFMKLDDGHQPLSKKNLWKFASVLVCSSCWSASPSYFPSANVGKYF